MNNKFEIEIYGKYVDCRVTDKIPADDVFIDEIVCMDKIQGLSHVDIYLRNKIDCPFGRGNWIIDIIFKDGQIFSVKLPSQMTEERVKDYCKPLLALIKTDLQ